MRANSVITLDVKNIALIAVLSAVTVVVAYAKKLSTVYLPGVVEVMTVMGFGCVGDKARALRFNYNLSALPSCVWRIKTLPQPHY